MNEVFAIMFPPTMFLWVCFVGQGPLQDILAEKQAHTLSRALAAPVTPLQFLFSKFAHCLLLCTAVQAVLVLLTGFLFHVGWGAPILVAAVLVASSCSITGLLGATYSLAKTKEQANALSSGVLILCGLLGGGMVPFESLPPFLQAVGQWSPNRWAVIALRGVQHARPFGELVKPLGMLLCIGLIGSAAALAAFKRRIVAPRKP